MNRLPPLANLSARRSVSALSLWLCVLALLLQEVYLYCLGGALFESGETADLMWRSLAAFPVVLGVLLLVVFGEERDRFGGDWRRMLWFAFLVFVLGCVMGLVFESSPRYFFGDAFRYTIPWLVILVVGTATWDLRETNQMHIVTQILEFLAVCGIFDAVVTIFLGYASPGLRISTGLFLFTVIHSFASRSWILVFRVISVILGLIAVVMSYKRVHFVAGVFVLVAVILSHVRNVFAERQIKRFKWFSTILLLMLCCLALAMQSELIEEISDRATDLAVNLNSIITGEVEDESYGYRLNELSNISGHYQEHSYEAAVGRGFGSEIPMLSETTTVSDNNKMHHVHLAWAAYFLRNGLLGVILLLSFFLSASAMLLRRVEPEYRPYVFTCAVFLGVEFVYSLSGNVMLESVDLPLVVGLGCGIVSYSASRTSQTASLPVIPPQLQSRG